jgi:hypothetical protein
MYSYPDDGAAVSSGMSVSAILHGVTSQKTAIFIANAMRTSNLIDKKPNT